MTAGGKGRSLGSYALPLAVVLGLVFALSPLALALKASDMDWGKLVGYTVVDVTSLPGKFDGAKPGKRVLLKNGMVFEFTQYKSGYGTNPAVVVFRGSFSQYRLLIDDDLYDAKLVK